MKKLLLAGVGLLSLVATSAVAADLPARMPTKAPAPYVPAAYNWSGWYLGINGGYGWGNSGWSDPSVPFSSGNFNADGGLIGGTLGVNWQTGAWVLGIEGDGDWSDIRGTSCFGTCETRNNWLATVRGRIGYSFDRFMPYFTGGLALGDIKATTPGFGSESDSRAGWTVGAGVEWAIAGPWTAKLEYLHVDLGDMTCNVVCSTGPTKVKFDADVVRAGINYRFSGPTSFGGPPGY